MKGDDTRTAFMVPARQRALRMKCILRAATSRSAFAMTALGFSYASEVTSSALHGCATRAPLHHDTTLGQH